MSKFFKSPSQQNALKFAVRALNIGVTMAIEYGKGYANKKGQIAAEQEHKARYAKLEADQTNISPSTRPRC